MARPYEENKVSRSSISTTGRLQGTPRSQPVLTSSFLDMFPHPHVHKVGSSDEYFPSDKEGYEQEPPSQPPWSDAGVK